MLNPMNSPKIFHGNRASTRAASGEQMSPRRRKPKILAGALAGWPCHPIDENGRKMVHFCCWTHLDPPFGAGVSAFLLLKTEDLCWETWPVICAPALQAASPHAKINQLNREIQGWSHCQPSDVRNLCTSALEATWTAWNLQETRSYLDKIGVASCSYNHFVSKNARTILPCHIFSFKYDRVCFDCRKNLGLFKSSNNPCSLHLSTQDPYNFSTGNVPHHPQDKKRTLWDITMMMVCDRFETYPIWKPSSLRIVSICVHWCPWMFVQEQ